MTDAIYLATISPPYESPTVFFAASKAQIARTKILKYLINEYGELGVNIDPTEGEWVGDESYAWFDAPNLNIAVEVREVEYFDRINP